MGILLIAYENGRFFHIEKGITREMLPKCFDRLTTSDELVFAEAYERSSVTRL